MGMYRNAALPHELAVVAIVASREAVERYAALTADYNPIHLDADFAGRTVFGRLIVHGTLGLNLVIEAIEQTFGEMPENLALDAHFTRAVPVGSTIKASGRLRDEVTGTHDIFVETEVGERAVEGVCIIGPTSNDRI